MTCPFKVHCSWNCWLHLPCCPKNRSMCRFFAKEATFGWSSAVTKDFSTWSKCYLGRMSESLPRLNASMFYQFDFSALNQVFDLKLGVFWWILWRSSFPYSPWLSWRHSKLEHKKPEDQLHPPIRLVSGSRLQFCYFLFQRSLLWQLVSLKAPFSALQLFEFLLFLSRRDSQLLTLLLLLIWHLTLVFLFIPFLKHQLLFTLLSPPPPSLVILTP